MLSFCPGRFFLSSLCGSVNAAKPRAANFTGLSDNYKRSRVMGMNNFLYPCNLIPPNRTEEHLAVTPAIAAFRLQPCNAALNIP